jgi:hypothetical protein
MDFNELLKEGDLIAGALMNGAAFFMSLLFYLFPPARKWHANLSPAWKPGFFAGSLAVVGVLIFLLSLFEIFTFVTPDIRGAFVLVMAWIISLATTQGTYATFVRPRKK